MTHTFEALKSGELLGTKRLKIAEGLTTFPEEIFTLADTLEVLDLSDNHISELPDNISDLKALRIIFFANNNFTVFPKALAACPNLSMIGFKANQIHTVPENAFPPLLRWLILTDNSIKVLPKSMGDIHLLQKCALAGNKIEELPNEMANCTRLELLRISANQLTIIPEWLFQLPRLSWVAFGGNPATHKVEIENDLPYYEWNDFTIKELLGEGASGLISKARWNNKEEDIAIKVFKGDVTSDGLPEDEMDIAIVAGKHKNLVEVLGKIQNHPEDKSGLIMKLISPDYSNLGNPPNLETCTRDTFEVGTTYSEDDLLKIAKSIASVCTQLHQKGINHGDLYAHNIMINKGESLLGDFGAASFYNTNSELAGLIEKVEVRAYGCLLEDVLSVTDIADNAKKTWHDLISKCQVNNVLNRPTFQEISEAVSKIVL